MKKHQDHSNHDHKHNEDTHEDHAQHHKHQDHHRMMIEDFKRRFWISLILTLPILLLSPMIQDLLAISWSFTGDGYVLFRQLLLNVCYVRIANEGLRRLGLL